MNFHLVNSDGEVLLSNLPDRYLPFYGVCNSESESVHKNKNDGIPFRHGKKTTTFGTAYIIATEEDLLNSSRVFKEKLNVYSNFLPEVANMKESVLKDILHNLTTINAHSIQEVYNLIPQAVLAKNVSTQLAIIEQALAQKPRKAANTFLRIAKENASMKAQFTALRHSYYSKRNLQIKSHPIRVVLLNVLHSFFPDFNDNNIHVEVEPTNKTVKLDYETFSAALVPLFDNATKYTQPNTTVNIKFVYQPHTIIQIESMSLEIKPDEVEKIFQKGFSGEAAIQAEKHGTGIGMGNIQKLLQFNNARIEIRPNVDPSKETIIKKFKYQNNIFEIHFG